jgi:acetyltransferase
MKSHYLNSLFNPKSIAVVGASERPHSVGMKVYKNLLEGNFIGKLYAVNPKHHQIYKQFCYSSIKDIIEPIDLVVITTPAHTVANIITECGEKGVRTAIVISSGFSETGKVGKDLEQDVLDAARRYQLRLIGPNCLGVMRPHINMNATFDNNFALPGSLALVSQSGALSAAILDWAINKDIGFSVMISLGNGSDVEFGDVLDCLAMDTNTHSILLYIEGIHHARHFISGLRAVARIKPVIVIKAGRHPQGSRAALSHTGALIGDDDVFDAAISRAGAVRVTMIEELFSATEILSSQCRVRGNRLAIITNGGGAGVMAADRAADLNVVLPSLTENTISELNKVLPSQWSHQNPIDIIGDANPERYHAALDICLHANYFDAVLAILVPVAMSQPIKVAEQIIRDADKDNLPILACWMGDKQVTSSWKLFENHKIPYFDTPEKAVQAFSYLAYYQYNQKLLLQVPGPLSPQPQPDIDYARSIIQSVLADHRSMLTTIESKNILKAFLIPVSEPINVSTADEAVREASAMGFPVAMKINSPNISHKQDVGGVMLNVSNAEAVRDAFDNMMKHVQLANPTAKINGITVERMFSNTNNRELMIGVIRDKVFGPAISFGMGGTLVEVIKDRAIALPPLNEFLAKQLIARTRVAKLLGNFRNMSAIDLNKIVNILLRVSEMVCELPAINEMDINPIIVNDKDIIAVDARIIVSDQLTLDISYSHLAIHPYPNHFQTTVELWNHVKMTIRPIRPEDAGIEEEFINHLSSQSKYYRFFNNFQKIPLDMLIRFTQIDYENEMALVATIMNGDIEMCIGIARYTVNASKNECEFALVIADAWQNQSIGMRMMSSLIEIAKMKGMKTMMGVTLADNVNMLKLAKRLNFAISKREDHTVKWMMKTL